MTPIQGDWTISSIGLPDSVLRKIYFDNARRLLARSLPHPTLRARRISADFDLTGRIDHPLWQTAVPVRIEQNSLDARVRPELSTPVRALWSGRFLYLAYECPYTRLTVFEPAQVEGKRYDMNQPDVSLWDRDVVEAFIAPDAQDVSAYVEVQVAPTNERLDLRLKDGNRDFVWRSQFESAVSIDTQAGVWRCELRIPLVAFGETAPVSGTRWRINLFRCDRAQQAFLALNPTLQGSFHVPERFAGLQFCE
jgi:hypothetical protein